jgi:ribosomal protein L37AE/L43A
VVFCPFCEDEYEDNQLVIEKVQMGLKEFHYVYSCPKCEKEL